ncbi:MAG TPA: AsnC family transcriptional regulator, partial [Solirubrobacteraceae bacterium]|nr:AsnC family transcriptional regulator [Solirubrobacteraceae bacterium]
MFQLDDVDRAILEHLSVDARLPNNRLDERVGLAPSTCLARVRALRE